MSAKAPIHVHGLRGVQAMLGLSRRTIEGLIELGFVQPARGPRNAWRFSFSDIVLLRTAHELQSAQIPPRRILRTLARLKASLPESMPLEGLRIRAVGDTIAVREQGAQWAADSGQLLFDFELRGGATGAVLSIQKAPAGAGEADAQAMFTLGEGLEASDAEAAEQAYRDALSLSPTLRDAYLNLGALLCEAGRAPEALPLYDTALKHCAPDALLHYNHAVALEDSGQLEQAARSYEASLSLDADLADAHHNLASLYDRMGRAQAALRHFSAYRRLLRAG